MKTIKELEAEQSDICTKDRAICNVERLATLKDVLGLIDEMNKEGYWNNFKELKKRING